MRAVPPGFQRSYQGAGPPLASLPSYDVAGDRKEGQEVESLHLQESTPGHGASDPPDRLCSADRNTGLGLDTCQHLCILKAIPNFKRTWQSWATRGGGSYSG